MRPFTKQCAGTAWLPCRKTPASNLAADSSRVLGNFSALTSASQLDKLAPLAAFKTCGACPDKLPGNVPHATNTPPAHNTPTARKEGFNTKGFIVGP
jgi:hypothetical protein